MTTRSLRIRTLGWITWGLEALMLLFTLFWAIEANATDMDKNGSRAHSREINAARANDDTGGQTSADRSVASKNKLGKLGKNLGSKFSWSLSGSGLVPPKSSTFGLGDESSHAQNRYSLLDKTDQGPKQTSTDEIEDTLSPTFEHNPLYAPSLMTLLRFRAL